MPSLPMAAPPVDTFSVDRAAPQLMAIGIQNRDASVLSTAVSHKPTPSRNDAAIRSESRRRIVRTRESNQPAQLACRTHSGDLCTIVRPHRHRDIDGPVSGDGRSTNGGNLL